MKEEEVKKIVNSHMDAFWNNHTNPVGEDDVYKWMMEVGLKCYEAGYTVSLTPQTDKG